MDLAATYSQTNSLTFDIFEEHLHKTIDKSIINSLDPIAMDRYQKINLELTDKMDSLRKYLKYIF